MSPVKGGSSRNDVYEVIKPNELYLGKTYGGWVCDWINWLFSIDPDKHNDGHVVFLRSLPFSSQPGYAMGLDPMIMVGNDKLEIFDDQAVLFPVIMAYWAATDPADTEVTL